MKNVHVSDEIAAVISLHPYLRDPDFRAAPIRDQIELQAETALRAHRQGDRRFLPHLLSWWSGAARRSGDEVMEAPFGADDAKATLSREYGYSGWDELNVLGDIAQDPEFETALDALIAGDEATLEQLIEQEPALATRQSRFGHCATLLHHLGANGVETWRQQTPLNAPALARLLIRRGADPSSKARMYGGGQTAYDLASTSVHPARAGVMDALLEALKTQETHLSGKIFASPKKLSPKTI